MKLIRRIKADVRGPGMSDQQVENIVNEELLILQRSGAEVLEIKEVTKDSGAVMFIVLYEDKKVK